MRQRQLGNLDYSNQKLAGRDSEKELLRSLCSNTSTQTKPVAAFVRGPSGSGKSLLVNTVFNEKGGTSADFLFLSGKFDQYRRSGDAYSVIVEAFSSLRSSAPNDKENDSALLEMIERLRAASSMDQSPHMNGNRRNSGEGSHFVGCRLEPLKYMLRDYLKKLCQRRRTVLFLDDLQWCDRSYVELISSFLNDTELSNFVFIGAIRTDGQDVENDPPELRGLYNLCCSTTMALTNLKPEVCNEIIADLLHMEPEATRSLAAAVHRKTDGNAFFVIQFVQMLERSKLMIYSMTHLEWKFDASKIEGETNLAANLVDTVVSKIRVLPFKAQLLLKVAACLGGRFDPVLVGKLVSSLPILDSNPNENNGLSVNDMLELCTKEGLIAKVSVRLGGINLAMKDLYKFTHDQIQQASYMLVEQSERPPFHLTLGRLLRDMMDDFDDDMLLLIATHQLNRGRVLIKDPAEKLQLTSLNLIAAQRLRTKSAFFPASDLINISLEILGEGRWGDQYAICLEALTTGAQIDYCCGNAARCQARVDEVLSHARSLEDKLAAYFTLVDLHSLSRDYAQALNVGYDLLKQLGVNVEKQAKLVKTAREFFSVTSTIRKRSDEDLLSMTMANDDRVVAIVKTMQLLLSAAYWTGRDNQYGYMVITMMKLTLKNGITNMSGAVFSSYAGACAVFGDFALAKRVGRLAQTFDQSIPDKTYRCKSMLHNLVFVSAPKNMYYLSLESFLDAHREGLKVGDLDHSSLASLSYATAYYLAGLPLASLVHDVTMFSTRMAEYGQLQTLACLKLYHQMALNLVGNAAGNPSRLEGEIIPDIDAFLTSDKSTSARRLQRYTILNLQLAFYFRDSEVAIIAAKDNASFQDSEWPGYHALIDPFFRALVWIEAARKRKGHFHARRARLCIKKMEKGAKRGLVNLYHMTLIARAEYATLKCKPSQTLQCKVAFDDAICVSTRSGFTQHAALANELAARFMLKCGDNEWGTHYIKMASDGYHNWGAYGKVKQLEEEFQGLSAFTKRAKRHGSVGLRGRSRFEEADQNDLYRGLSQTDLWSVGNSDEGSTFESNARSSSYGSSATTARLLQFIPSS